MQELIEAFITERAAQGRSHYTIKSYRIHLTHFLNYTQQNNQQTISRRMLVGYVAHLRATKSQNTASNYVATVSVFLNWLVDIGELDSNPAHKLKPKRTIRRMPSYTKPQIEALLRGASLRDKAIMLALLDTGLRASELCSLKRGDVDWSSGYFQVVGKGGKERANWFSVFTLKALKAYLAERTDNQPALFVSYKNKPLNARQLYTVIQRRAEAAGIRDTITRILHSFRATFARNYLRRGDAITLAALLGHSTLAMTKRYAELNDDELREKKELINPLAVFVDEAA